MFCKLSAKQSVVDWLKAWCIHFISHILRSGWMGVTSELRGERTFVKLWCLFCFSEHQSYRENKSFRRGWFYYECAHTHLQIYVKMAFQLLTLLNVGICLLDTAYVDFCGEICWLSQHKMPSHHGNRGCNTLCKDWWRPKTIQARAGSITAVQNALINIYYITRRISHQILCQHGQSL